MTRRRARARPRASPFDSILEERYSAHLAGLKAAGEIREVWYHRIGVRLPGGYYYPDFLVENNDGTLDFHETKREGKTKDNRLRIGWAKVRAGAEILPIFGWVYVTHSTRSGWQLRRVE